jgi:hypothetical protein
MAISIKTKPPFILEMKGGEIVMFIRETYFVEGTGLGIGKFSLINAMAFE